MKYLFITISIFLSSQAFSYCEGLRDYNQYNGDWQKFTPEWGCMGTGEIVISDGVWAINPKDLNEDNLKSEEIAQYALYLESQLERIVVSNKKQKGKITIHAIFHNSKNTTLTISAEGEITENLIDQIQLFLPKVLPLIANEQEASFQFDYKVNWNEHNKAFKQN